MLEGSNKSPSSKPLLLVIHRCVRTTQGGARNAGVVGRRLVNNVLNLISSECSPYMCKLLKITQSLELIFQISIWAPSINTLTLDCLQDVHVKQIVVASEVTHEFCVFTEFNVHACMRMILWVSLLDGFQRLYVADVEESLWVNRPFPLSALNHVMYLCAEHI